MWVHPLHLGTIPVPLTMKNRPPRKSAAELLRKAPEAVEALRSSLAAGGEMLPRRDDSDKSRIIWHVGNAIVDLGHLNAHSVPSGQLVMVIPI